MTVLNDACPAVCHLVLGRFRIVIVVVANEALAVANHPDFPVQSAIDNGRSSEPLFRMLGQMLQPAMHPTAYSGVTLAYVLGNPEAELMTCKRLRCLAQIAGNEFHGVAAIASTQTKAPVGLACRAVDDSDEVISDDDSVFAFLLCVLRDYVLFYDRHGLADLLALYFSVAAWWYFRTASG